ncbi:RIB43A-like with coiled-coils protein 2 [Lycorma delicatula]|uniref:RIB43A-like with coiled-coils protein 2 n=1 Tax=Lycorma delicatula TaxID=130591 RepID=UPI003F5147B1
MLNLFISLPKDRREAAKIEKARQYEETRKNRIFNPRIRLIGVDKDALKKQMAEKKARDEDEKAREEAHRLKLLRDNEIALELEKEVVKRRRKLDEEINEFRLQYQRKEDRRDFDLYDPDYLKKSLPARVMDDDPRLSISGAQKFEGEDMEANKRKKYQMEQQKIWLQQQIDERIQAEKDKKLAEFAYDEMVLARDERSKQLESLENECKRQLDEATARFNQALSAEQATQRRMQEMRDLEDKRAEIYNAITGDFLTENPDTAISCLGLNRIIGSQYKGMHPHEKEAIRKEQLQQIEENKMKREAEKKLESDWAELSNYMLSTVALNEQEIKKRQRELNRQLYEQNKLLCMQQRKNKELTEEFVKSAGATEEFYNQFNKSTR